MRHLALLLILAATTATGSLRPAQAEPQSKAVYAWCAAISAKDNSIYMSEVFDAYGMERDISSQWYGLMQHHYINVDLTSARCVLFGREVSLESARVDRDHYAEELQSGIGAGMLKVDTRWAVVPYS